MKWYKHDSHAHTDAKLKRVIMTYGMEGYGLYWYCLELIAKNVDTHNLTFELEDDAELISHATGIHTERVNEMLAKFVNLGLFECSENRIFCLKMERRCDEYTQKALKKSDRNHQLPTNSGECPEKVRSIRTEEIRTEQNRTEETRSEQQDLLVPDESGPPPTPHKFITSLYSEILPELPAIRVMTDKRKTRIKTVHGKFMDGDIDNWRGYFEAVKRTPFLIHGSEDRNWRADFDFLLTEKAIVGVLEGKYT